MNRSTVYKRKNRLENPSQRQKTDAEIVEKIQEIQENKRFTYGIDRVTKELERNGVNVNHKRVARLMSAHSLNAVIRKKRSYFCSVEQDKRRKRLPSNILNREFEASKPRQKLVSDVTYIPMPGLKWCYVSFVR